MSISSMVFQWLEPLLPDMRSLDCAVVAIKPGKVFTVDQGIELNGVERFESTGDILITTVSFEENPNILDWMVASAGELVGMYTREALYGDLSPRDHREHSDFLMRASKESATVAALGYLGMEAAELVGVGFTNVMSDTPAVGRLESGEVVVAVDGQPVTTVASLLELMDGRLPGMSVLLTVRKYVHADEPAPENGPSDLGIDDGGRVTAGKRAVASDSDGAGEEDRSEGGERGSDGEDGSEFGDDAVVGHDWHIPGGEWSVSTETEYVEREEEILLGAHSGDNRGLIGISGLYEALVWKPIPFEVGISSGTIGGPSAGLAFTLALIDALTPGELSGGLSVAVSGSISTGGGVGDVGGLPQKAAVARRAGADLFIVPEALHAEASSTAGSMPVVGVGSLEEAIEVLGEHGGDVPGLALALDYYDGQS